MASNANRFALQTFPYQSENTSGTPHSGLNAGNVRMRRRLTPRDAARIMPECPT